MAWNSFQSPAVLLLVGLLLLDIIIVIFASPYVRRSPVWMVVFSTVCGFLILWGACVVITTACPAKTTPLCEALYTRPPWILLSGLVGSVGLLWSWWLRTTTKKEAEERAKDLAQSTLDLGRSQLDLDKKELEVKEASIKAEGRAERLAAHESFLSSMKTASELISSKEHSSILSGVRILIRSVRSSLENEHWGDAIASLETLNDIYRRKKKELEGNPTDGDAEVVRVIAAATRFFDYKEATLRAAYLEGADLRWAELTDANLMQANLKDANLERAVLRGADLRGADLRGAILENTDLVGAKLEKAKLTWDKYLGGAIFRPEDIENAVYVDEKGEPIELQPEPPTSKTPVLSHEETSDYFSKLEAEPSV